MLFDGAIDQKLSRERQWCFQLPVCLLSLIKGDGKKREGKRSKEESRAPLAEEGALMATSFARWPLIVLMRAAAKTCCCFSARLASLDSATTISKLLLLLLLLFSYLILYVAFNSNFSLLHALCRFTSEGIFNFRSCLPDCLTRSLMIQHYRGCDWNSETTTTTNKHPINHFELPFVCFFWLN